MVRKITVAETLDMSVEERLRLVGDIWDSIAEAPESLRLSQEQRDELDRRLRDLEENPDAGDPWGVVRARIEGSR
jgi:putative addiction module component (TIGR02574 family)